MHKTSNHCYTTHNAVVGCTTPPNTVAQKNVAKCHGMRKTIVKCHSTKENAAKHCSTEGKCCQTLQHKEKCCKTMSNTATAWHTLQLHTAAAGRMPLDNAQHKKAWQHWQQCNGNANDDAKPLPHRLIVYFLFFKECVWQDFFPLSIVTSIPFPESLWSLGTSETFSRSRHHHCSQWLKLVGCSNCCGMTCNASEHCSMTCNASECCSMTCITLQTLQHKEKHCQMLWHEENHSKMLWHKEKCCWMLWHGRKMLPNSAA